MLDLIKSLAHADFIFTLDRLGLVDRVGKYTDWRWKQSYKQTR